MQFSVFEGEVCQYCVQAEDTKNVIKIKSDNKLQTHTTPNDVKMKSKRQNPYKFPQKSDSDLKEHIGLIFSYLFCFGEFCGRKQSRVGEGRVCLFLW